MDLGVSNENDAPNAYVKELQKRIADIKRKLAENQEKQRLVLEQMTINHVPRDLPAIIDASGQTAEIENKVIKKKEPVFHVPESKSRKPLAHNQKGKWNKKQDILLLQGRKNGKNWTEIAKTTNKSESDCAARSCSLLKKENVKWTKEMDACLNDLVLKHGDKNFAKIAQELNGNEDLEISTSLSQHQVSHRYKYHTRPGFNRGAWSDEEDLQLMIALQYMPMNEENHGRWVELSKLIPTRTDVQIRKRVEFFQKHVKDLPITKKKMPSKSRRKRKNAAATQSHKRSKKS